MKRYGYHRTSTREQHLDRGIKEITAYCEQNNLELEKIFTDQQTGKNFNRPRYQVLKEDVLRVGDELIITEVDRLGATVYAMHRFMEEQGYALDITDQRMHHEIYLSDARRVAPEKLKTVVRHPIKTMGK